MDDPSERTMKAEKSAPLSFDPGIATTSLPETVNEAKSRLSDESCAYFARDVPSRA
jgi:hypothetical protein